MTLAVAMPTAAELISRALERQYIRDGIGQFADMPGVGDDAPLSAKLKGAGRIDLQPGEQLLRSDRTKGENGRVWLAVTETDGRKSLRIGLGNAQFGTRRDDNGPWRAARDRSYEINEERQDLIARREDLENEIEELEADPNADSAGLAARRAQLDELDNADVDEVFPNGHTAILDENGARQLRETLDKALDDSQKKQAAFDEIDRLENQRDKLRQIITREFTDEEDAEWDRLAERIEALEAGELQRPPEGYWTFAEGSIPGEWADVHYEVYLDDPSIGVEAKLAAIPHHYDETFDDMSQATASFDIVEADELVQLLAKMETGARSPESSNRSDLGVRSMPAIRALEALSSPAVQLMMWARTLEAADSFTRRGKLVHVERGRGGRFGHGVVGDVVDAVQKAASPKPRQEIRQAYREVSAGSKGYVRLDEVRARLGHVPRDEVDRELKQMAREKLVHLAPNDYQFNLTPEQRAGSVEFGGRDNHLLMVEDGGIDATPSPPKPRRSAVAKAMASGDTNALDGFGREALRREAKSRGIDLPRGVHEDVIRDMLWDHDHNEYAETFKAPEPDRPKPGGSASGLGRDSGEEEIFAAFNRMGSEQEIKDALAGKDADTLRFLGEEIGVRTHRNDTDPEKIKAHIARSVAAGLSNVRFRTGARGNDRDVADAAPASSAKPARTSRAKADTPDGSYFSTFAVGFKASQQADREKALAKKAAAEPSAPKVARRTKATKPDRAEQMAAISGRADVWGDLRKAHEEEGHAAPLESSRPAKAFKPVRRPKPLTAEERRANADAISGGQDIWGKLRQAHEEDRAKAAPKAKADVPSAVDALKPMVDNAKPGDRERTAEILSKLTGKQLEEVAQSFGSTVSHHRTVGQKRTQLTERLVGHQLNSNTIRNGVWEDSDAQTAKFEQQQSIARRIKADSAPSAARKVMGTQMSLPMQQALVKVEDSGGLEMRRAEFQNDYKLNDREFDQLLDNGFIEVDEKAGMGFIGITPRGLKALDALKGDR